MIIPAEVEALVSVADAVSVPVVRVTGRNCVALPPRLRNDRSSGLVRADPQYAASHPHGCRAISSSTLNGIRSLRFSVKYHASGGTSYSVSHAAPAFSTNGSPVTPTTRSRNWNGGPGSRAMVRSESNTRYGSPNASDGFPTANAVIRAVSYSTRFGGTGIPACALAAQAGMP